MPNRCVVAGCSNVPDIKNGLVIHTIPYFGNDDPVPKKRRKKWVDFVNQTRKNFTATKNSGIFSAHFTPESFQRRFHFVQGQDKPCIPRLVRDDIGIAVTPSEQSDVLKRPRPLFQSEARRRR